MSLWVEDPQLFLHKGGDGVVRVLRCKKESTTLSSSSMLMKPEDLTDEGEITNLQSLTGGRYDWDKNKYDALIDYIYPRHLLVNCHGSVIVELESDEKSVSAQLFKLFWLMFHWLLVNLFHKNNKSAALVYVRALDIIDMGCYGPGLDHPGIAVPVRTVKYLQNGMPVQKEPSSKEMELNEEVEKLRHELLLAKDANEAESAKDIKLVEELARKSNEVESLQQKLLQVKDQIEVELAKENKLTGELAEKGHEMETLLQDQKRLLKENSVRIYPKAAAHCSLTIRNGKTIIGYTNESDYFQYWVKDENYGKVAKDQWDVPGFALVNKYTSQALKPTDASTVELVHYDPNVFDKSILWTESKQSDGYKAIRKLTNTGLNLDAANPYLSGIGDGTIAILCNWLAGDNQKWDIVSY